MTTPIILISINFIQNKLIFTLLRRAWPYVKLIYSLPRLFCVILIVHKVSVLHQVPCPLFFYKSCTEPGPSEPLFIAGHLLRVIIAQLQFLLLTQHYKIKVCSHSCTNFSLKPSPTYKTHVYSDQIIVFHSSMQN